MEKRVAVMLALGRIFRLASRPEQPGDAAEYERCRAIILNALCPVGGVLRDWQPNYVRDRNKGSGV